MGVSIETNSNIDLDAIIAGGDAFRQRLERFTEAKNLLETAKRTQAEAEMLLQHARETQASADEQLAANVAAAEQLTAAQEAAENERANLAAKLETMLAIARG